MGQQALHSKSVIGAMDAIGVKARVEALFGVASALAYIHSQNLVHRDVKTGNVLLATPIDGGIMPQLKLSDFGFSKTVGTDMTQYKGTVRIIATGWSAEPEDRPSAIDLMNRLSA